MLLLSNDGLKQENKHNLFDLLDTLDDNALEMLSHSCDIILQERFYKREKKYIQECIDDFSVTVYGEHLSKK